MKKNTTTREVLAQIREATKRQNPYPGRYKGWVNIWSPLALQVTKERFIDGLAIVEALLEALPERGMRIKSSKESQRIEGERVQLCIAYRSDQFTLKIAEGYRQDPGNEPCRGSGVLRLQLNGYHRWEDRKRAGSVVEQIPKILDWIEEQTLAWESMRAELQALELERESARRRALDLARKMWVLDAIAETAITQAESWQRAATLRTYREALVSQYSELETVAWADWIGEYADTIDPLLGPPPMMPEVKAPPDWELQPRNR
jgi:hypothetical protein